MRTKDEQREWEARRVAEMGKGYPPSVAAEIADRFFPEREAQQQKDGERKPVSPS